MMRGPPAAPTTSSTLPSGSSTIVGDIALSIRLPGAMAFASPCTRPNMFGVPGLRGEVVHLVVQEEAAASDVHTPEPYPPLSVVVVATAFPLSSTTE